MKSAMKSPRARNRTPLSFPIVCALIFGLATAHVGADPDITPDQRRAASAVTPQIPDGAHTEKRELKLDYSTVPVGLHIVLPPPSEEEKQSMEKGGGKGPVAIGFHRDVPGDFKGDISGQLEWIEQPDGSFVSSTSVTSPGAEAVRVGIRADLPPGGEIRFFGEDSDQLFPVFTGEDFTVEGGEIRTLWSPSVQGDTIGIEITLPSEKPLSAFWLTIDAVSHAVVPTGSLPLAPKLDCPHLHIDVACRSSSIHGNLQNAVAHIQYEDDAQSWICSGTLLSDRDDDPTTRYFLTANHCVDTGTVARTVIAFWFYQNARCNVDSLDSRYTQTSGTDLMTTNVSYDLSLIRFRETLPGGLVLSGWDANPIDHPAEAYGIHHPSGAVKSYSAGTTEGSRYSDGVQNAIHMRWSDGTTEGGSSGSGLFLRDSGYLVGGLSHGPACGYSIVDRYGPFEDFYVQAIRWLDPDNAPPVTGGDDHGDSAGDATPVGVPSSTPGNLELGGDLDHFRFELASAGELVVYTEGPTDTYGTLTRAGSGFSRVDDDLGEDTNFRIRVADAQAGTYHVEVRGYFSSTTGTYTLHVSAATALGPADHVLPLVSAASNLQTRGLIRIINRSNRRGTAEVYAIDDTGEVYGPVTLSVDAMASRHVLSVDLEDGNAAVGLPIGVGDGTGDWRVELRSDLDIDALAYSQTPDGFITSMHLVAEETETGSMIYDIPFFNPASNVLRASSLRIINPGTQPAEVTIAGVDRRGDAAPGGEVSFTLPGGEARSLSAQELESGRGLQGRLGDGSGKWRLIVSSDRPIQVLSLMRSDSGHLSNLSR